MANIFWGVKPRADGSYCNINMDKGTINYIPPVNPKAIILIHRKGEGVKLSEAMKSYSKLDDMVRKTISMFAKEHIDLFNMFINET